MNTNHSKRMAATTATVMAAASSSYAQDAVSFVNEATSQVRAIGGGVYTLVVVVICLVALIALVVIAIKLNGQDHEVSQKAVGAVAGVIFCILFAMVIKNFMGV